MLGYQPHVAHFRLTKANGNAIVIMLSAIVLFAQLNGYAQLQQDFPVTNSVVSAMVMDSSTMYIGGFFDYAGPNTGNSVLLDTSTGKYDSSFPKANGVVYASAPDGKGGWYIGGSFTKVGKVYRNGLAHIKPDGSVDDWNPNVMVKLTSGDLVSGIIYSIALLDSTVYFVGIFDQVGGKVRNMAAAVNTITGLPTAWNPDADNAVRAIIATPSTIYLGGGFHFLLAKSIKIPRSGLASVDPLTGMPMAWDPSAGIGFSQTVNCLLLFDSTIYVGGNFSMLGSVSRNGIGAVHAITGLVTPWNPNTGNVFPQIQVSALELSGNVMYIGGTFKKMGRLFRNNLAAANSSGTGTVLPWDPNVFFVKRGTSGVPSGIATPGVYSITASGSNVYVGGFFNRAGGEVRRNLASFDTSRGVATAWNPKASLAVLVLKKSGTILYAGGEFASVNGFTRYNLAAIDLKTKTVNAWDPSVNEPVEALALYGSKIFVGGYFDTVGTQNTAIIAAVDKNTGVVDPWTLNTVSNGGVGCLSIYKDRLYAGGWFYKMGDSVRSGVAAIDLISGKVLPWYPGEMRSPYSFALTDSLVYMGGSFGEVGSAIRPGLCAVNTQTGITSSWNPFQSFNGGIFPKKILSKNKTLYMAGYGLPLNSTGTSTTSILKMDAVTGMVLPFDPKIELGYYGLLVNDIAIADSTLYAVGYFSSAGGLPRNNIVSLDVSTGTLKPWNPKLNTSANVVLVSPSEKTIYFGGAFSNIDDDPASFLAAYTDTSLGALTSVEERPEQQPREFTLDQNYPNPFNPTTTISYSIPANAFVTLKVFNILGQEIALLVNENLAAGKYTATFNASNLTSGVYFYRIEAGVFHSVKKMLLIK